jgi:hypothetical protein
VQQIGAMAIDFPGGNVLAFPGIVLPDNLSTTSPYQATSPTHPTGIPVNPGLLVGYPVKLCNLSSVATAVLQGINIQIASQSVLGGTAQKDVGEGDCASFFQLPNTITGGGCGGSVGPHEGFSATWPASVSVGTAAAAPQDSITTDTGGKTAFGPLPISIKPGNTLFMYVGMTSYPAPDGTYTFTFGLRFSGFVMTYATIQTQPVQLYTHARQWDGIYCSGATALTAKMTTGQTYFCPKP